MFIRKAHLRADHVLGQLAHELPFTLINPENADAVRKKFLRKPFEPEFAYAEAPDTQRIRQRLSGLRLGRTRPGRLLRAERDELKRRCGFAEAIGTKDIGKSSTALYGEPGTGLVRSAKGFLDLPGTPEDVKIAFPEVRAIMKEAFAHLGFSYSIKRSSIVSSAYASTGTRTLQLRSKERFGRAFALRMTVHELATHALRAENGRQQPLSIFSRGTPGYLSTEEGLAAYNEERAGLMSTDVLRTYAGRVLAVAHAKKHSLVDTYEYLRQWYGKDKAFILALRAKRGVPHGSDKGGCTKDLVYLKGYLAVKEYAAAGGDLNILHAAKIGLGDLPVWAEKLEAPKHSPQPLIEWARQEALKTRKA